MKKFYEMISPSLKQRVAVSIYTDILKHNLVLNNVVKNRIDELSFRNESISRKLSNSKPFKTKVSNIIISMIVS